MNLKDIAPTLGWRDTRARRYSWPRSRTFAGFWLLFDQGIFALSNFIINLLFARWLSATDYGFFVMSFSICTFLAMIHYSIILEPLLVQSAQVPWTHQRSYIGSLFRAHLILLAGSIVIAAVGYELAVLITHRAATGWVVASGLVGGIAMLTLITGRRLCLVFVSAKSSALIGTGYLLGSVLTGFVFHRFVQIGWLDIWIIIGAWSLLGSGATFWLAYRHSTGSGLYRLREIVSFAKAYLHWGLAASVFGWARFDGLFFLLAHFCGLAVVAETRAVFNICNPLLQINIAVQTSILVWFSRDRAHGSKRNVIVIIALHALVFALILPILGYYAEALVRLAYSDRYGSEAWQLPLFGIMICMNSLDSIISNVFKARRMFLHGYASQIASGAVAMIIGVVLIPVQSNVIFVSLIATGLGLVISFTLRMRTKL